MKKFFSIIMFVFLVVLTYSQTIEVPFTLDDRDRIIKTEQKIESLRNEMNIRFEAMEAKNNSLRNEIKTKFDSQQVQLNDLKTLFYWGFGIIITLIIFMMGYMIWDRRTALNPVREKTFSLSNRTDKLENALIELSKTDNKLAEILRTFGVL
ncbi:MAG: hypothetical protein JEY97_10225 [Bacteroidales bacterium]|nr:hypothetical protein [Bacteroidales bacterium]